MVYQMRNLSTRTYALLSSLTIVAGAAALIVSDAGHAETGSPLAPEAPALLIAPAATPGDAPASLLGGATTPSSAETPSITGPLLDAQLECVAKVIHHEAANQSRRGQRAVAHVMINRSRSGRFPASLCDVANQPGQFFNVAAYNPRRDTQTWRTAVEIAREALDNQDGDITNGSYYYHAANSGPNRFFRSRERVMQLEDHIFYR